MNVSRSARRDRARASVYLERIASSTRPACSTATMSMSERRRRTLASLSTLLVVLRDHGRHVALVSLRYFAAARSVDSSCGAGCVRSAPTSKVLIARTATAARR